MTVVPDARVAVSDAAAALHRGRFHEHDARAALRELAEVHEVPVGDMAVLRRVLAHRRNDDAVLRLNAAQPERSEQNTQKTKTPLPIACRSNRRYASSA